MYWQHSKSRTWQISRNPIIPLTLYAVTSIPYSVDSGDKAEPCQKKDSKDRGIEALITLAAKLACSRQKAV